MLTVMSLGIAVAQDQSIRTVKDAELIVPRPQLKPMKSLDPTVANALDTLDTSTPGVKLILFEDFTWKYFRDPAMVMSQSVFTENWSSDKAVPYTVGLDEIPDRISLWIVDSLGAYACPYQTKVYSPFGYRHRRRHQGVDLPLKTGTPVYAAFSGKVRISKPYTGYGNLVVIRHENGLETFYGHLSKREVEAGDWVEAGQEIGLGGSTGRSTGPHLHFETRYRGFAFDPQWIADFESGELHSPVFVLKRLYLDPSSRYVPESLDEEDDIFGTDEAIAAEEARLAAERAAMRWHTVRSGETISAIAIKEHVSQAKIKTLNPGLNINKIRIGQKIRVN